MPRHVLLALIALLTLPLHARAQDAGTPEPRERPQAVGWDEADDADDADDADADADPEALTEADDEPDTEAPPEAAALAAEIETEVVPPAPTPDPPAEEACGARAHAVAVDAVVRVRSGGQWGAGFAYRDARTVITAFSLMALGQPVRVVTRDGVSVDARLLARDESMDLAILELDTPLEGVTPLAPAPETSARLGAPVVAIGHHFPGAAAQLGERGEGLLRWSLTHGRIGAVNLEGVQADLAVSAGNAGGPLLDCEGRVLGSFAGAGLLSADLGLVARIARVDELLAENPSADDFWGDMRLRIGLGAIAHLDEEGRVAGGFYVTLGATLFDRLSWMNRVGLLWGGVDGPTGAELSVDRQQVRVESLLGWRFFIDVFGLTTMYIVPAGGVSVIHETLGVRSASVTPMCDPGTDGPCVSFSESSTDQWIVRPAIGLTFLLGGNFEIGYTLEIGLETDPVETYHALMVGFLF